MNIVKKIAAALIIAASVTSAAYAQEKKAAKMELKEHSCTATCKDGKHMYACGEKGHACTKECKKEVKTDKKTEKKM